ncbi:3-deoxy-7-phosphoheptulonate synthase [Abyssisolibacter fermentans]|uniref:3-deoxy-7-phosphoheptulonate synthase n=1 Tax=Abyssisolibacter fermentans TaxID=1766203 RepID=UPI000836836F|nr:3-deoxy-7-phosphoheptulonate synthase [Abyssisolibacter fermentans]
MIIVIRPKTQKEQLDKLKEKIKKLGLQIHESIGQNYHILGLIGDTRVLDLSQIEGNRIVQKLIHVGEPYKKANRLFKPEDTIIKVGDRAIGNGEFSVIAGPCSVETKEQVIEIARQVKSSGADFLRGGAFKPRTSPYSFQGLGQTGLEYLKEAKKETGLPIVTEMMSPEMVEKYADDIDIIQIGARNMQNFDLLKKVGKLRKPVLLKRGLSATIEELLMSAEYIMSEGNEQVILCERGIRTFEKFTRNTLDLSAIPVIKKLSHLPIIVDPSHAAGLWWLVEPLAMAALVVGADGLMVEVHNDPANAKCDGQQSIKPEKFNNLMNKLSKLKESMR